MGLRAGNASQNLGVVRQLGKSHFVGRIALSDPRMILNEGIHSEQRHQRDDPRDQSGACGAGIGGTHRNPGRIGAVAELSTDCFVPARSVFAEKGIAPFSLNRTFRVPRGDRARSGNRGSGVWLQRPKA